MSTLDPLINEFNMTQYPIKLDNNLLKITFEYKKQPFYLIKTLNEFIPDDNNTIIHTLAAILDCMIAEYPNFPQADKTMKYGVLDYNQI